jgi:hypothetical protein
VNGLSKENRNDTLAFHPNAVVTDSLGLARRRHRHEQRGE